MSSNKTYGMIFLALVVVAVALYFIVTIYFSKISFDTESIDGKLMTTMLAEFKSYNKEIDDKNARALFYSLHLMKQLSNETLLKIDSMDADKIKKTNEIFKFIDEKNFLVNNIGFYMNFYPKCFYDFNFKKVDDKNYLNANECTEYISKNEKVINEIGKNSEDYFTEDCVKYLITKNFYVSQSSDSAFSALEIILARYIIFANEISSR